LRTSSPLRVSLILIVSFPAWVRIAVPAAISTGFGLPLAAYHDRKAPGSRRVERERVATAPEQRGDPRPGPGGSELLAQQLPDPRGPRSGRSTNTATPSPQDA